jgi:hypothetical protein
MSYAAGPTAREELRQLGVPEKLIDRHENEVSVCHQDAFLINYLIRTGRDVYRQTVATTKTDINTGEHYETDVWVVSGNERRGFKEVMSEDWRDAVNRAMLQVEITVTPTFFSHFGWDETL